MNIRFVDIENDQNGRVYNGLPPFINWFDEKCSTGLIYYKRLTLIVQGNPGTLTFTLPENSIFKFYDSNSKPTVCDCAPIPNEIILAICKGEFTRVDEPSLCGCAPIDNADILNIVGGRPYDEGGIACACGCQSIGDQTILDIVGGTFTPIAHQSDPTEEKIDPWETLSTFVHYDLNVLLTTEIDVQPHVQGGYAWYNVYVIASTNVEGEYIDDITIANDGTIIRIGAEFFTDNEVLQINLRNMGVEIPNDICRAFYSTDLFEENPNYVLLNRKWRELLQNYMNVIGNKGSYKSLLNSMKWFEYGPLTLLREVWKYDTPAGTKYAIKPIKQYLTEETRKELCALAKTTHYILSQPAWSSHQTSPQFTTVQPVEYNHDWNEEALVNTSARWAKDEMRMKMTLLGQFFETYFMPIHLNLWTSTVEDILFPDPFQLIFGSIDVEENLCINESLDFGEGGNENVNGGTEGGEGIGDNGEIDPDSPTGGTIDLGGGAKGEITVQLGEVHVVGTCPETFYNKETQDISLNGFYSNPYNITTYDNTLLGCEGWDEYGTATASVDKNTWDENLVWMKFFSQDFSGIGSVIRIKASGFQDDVIRGQISTNITGQHVIRNAVFNQGKQIDFKILAQRPGDFVVGLTFWDASDNKYTKSVVVHVKDNLYPTLHYYKLVATDGILPDPFDASTPVSNLFMMRRVREPNIKYNYDKNTNDIINADLVGEYKHVMFLPAQSSVPVSGGDIQNVVTHNGDRPPILTPMHVRYVSESTATASVTGTILNALADTIERTYRLETGQQLLYCRTGYPTADAYPTTDHVWGWIQIVPSIHITNMDEIVAGGKTLRQIYSEIDTLPMGGLESYNYTQQVFLSEYHHLVEIKGENIEDRTIPAEFPVVIIPRLTLSRADGTFYDLPYSKSVEYAGAMDPEWEFYSTAKLAEVGQLKYPTREPMMLSPTRGFLPAGAYKVTFRWRMGEEVRELSERMPFLRARAKASTVEIPDGPVTENAYVDMLGIDYNNLI